MNAVETDSARRVREATIMIGESLSRDPRVSAATVAKMAKSKYDPRLAAMEATRMIGEKLSRAQAQRITI